ncbi:hypothetical protein D3C72_1403970 [compost metagenome]
MLAIGEAVYAARQDGELVPHREEVEAEGEIPVRHRLQRLVGGVEGPGDEGHQIVGDEGKQGGQHGDDGEGRPLSIPHGKVAGIQGTADKTGLTGLGTILKAIALLGQTGTAGGRQGELGRQGEGGLLGDQLGRGLYPLLELIQPDLHLLIMTVGQQVPGEEGDEQQGAPEGDEKFFADREVNEITVNPPEFNFFHNGIASCKGESVVLIIALGENFLRGRCDKWESNRLSCGCGARYRGWGFVTSPGSGHCSWGSGGMPTTWKMALWRS